MHKEFEIEEYTAIEEQIHYYSQSLLVPVQQLIIEYSLDLARIRRYLNLET